MVDSFSTWCFDTSRQAGDTAIVRSDYGYHIMYFVSENDQTVYNYTITQTLASEDTNTQITEIEDAYTITDNFFGKFYNQKDVDFSN